MAITATASSIGFWFNPGQSIVFTKNSAQVNNEPPLPLCIPSNTDMPLSDSLRSKSVQWLLREGYVPVVRDQVMTFVHPNDPSLRQPIIDQMVSAMQWVVKELKISPDDVQDITLDLLKDFKENLETGKFNFALECISKVYEKYPKVKIIRELFADCLHLNGDFSAIIHYLELANEGEGRYFLEKALVRDPSKEIIYDRLSPLYPYAEKRLALILFGLIFNRNNRKQRDLFYQRARELDPKNPLSYHVYLSCLETDEKESKSKAFRELANLTKEEKEFAAYSRKSLMEEISSSLDDLKGFCANRQSIRVKKTEDQTTDDLNAVNAELEKDYIEQIDLLMENEFYDEAREVIHQAIKLLEEKHPFYKRLCILNSMQNTLTEHGVISQLCDYYYNKMKYYKVEILIKSMPNRSYETNCMLAMCLGRQSKIEESAHLFLALALSEYEFSRYETIAQCLQWISSIDYSLKTFNSNQQWMIHELRRAVELNQVSRG